MPRRLREGRIQRPRKRPEGSHHQGLSRHNPGVGIMPERVDRDPLAEAEILHHAFHRTVNAGTRHRF